MDLEHEPNGFPLSPNSETNCVLNDGTSSMASEKHERPRLPTADFNRSRKLTHDSTDPTELDVLFLTEQLDALKRDLEQERWQRQEDMKLAHRAIQRVYNDCTALTSRESARLAIQEQKVDSLTGRYRTSQDELKALKKQVESTISTAATLRSRIEEVERQTRAPQQTQSQKTPAQLQPQSQPQSQSQSQSQAQAQEPQTKHTLDGITDNEPRSSSLAGKARNSFWTAQIIFVLNAARPNVFEVDGVAYLKLQSRSSRHRVVFSSDSSLSFVLGVEGSFPNVLRNRLWMPLASHRISDSGGNARITLDRLPSRQRESDMWNREFLESNCVTYDAAGKAHIYIALQNGELTLDDVNGVPPKGETRNQGGRQPSSIPASALMSPAKATTPTASAAMTARTSIQDNLRPPLNKQLSGKARTIEGILTTSAAEGAGIDQPTLQAADTESSKPFRNWAGRSTTKSLFEPVRSSGATTPLGVVIPPRQSSKNRKPEQSFFGDWKRGNLFRRNTGNKLAAMAK